MVGEEETIKSNKEWLKKLGIFSQKIGIIPEDMVPKCKTQVQLGETNLGSIIQERTFEQLTLFIKIRWASSRVNEIEVNENG